MENEKEKHSMPNDEETKEQTEPRWKADNEEGNDSEIEGLDEEEETTVPISDQKNIRSEKADRSLSELQSWFEAGDLIVDPEWQRNYVWNNNQASKLIESFLLSIPVPVIYLAKTKEDKYEVIDGLQRLTSVFNFFDNKYKLTHLDQMTDQNGKMFQDLAKPLQRRLKKATIRTFELSSDTDPNLHFIVFERLNTGGTKLNEMEIRNCLYRGSLNDLIKQLVLNDNFKSCLAQTNKFTARMQDRNFVLHFLAFYEKTYHKYKNPLKKFLNEFQDAYQNPPTAKLQEYRQKFEHCMRCSSTVFGQDGYQLKKQEDPQTSKSHGEWSRRINISIF